MSQTRHTINGELALKAGAAYTKDGLTKPVYLMGDAELEKFATLIRSKHSAEMSRAKLNQMFLEQAA